jgi:hypothetical protein
MTRFKREPLTLFAECGMLLFGDLYVTQLGEALNVAPRTVQRWSSGAREVPPHVWGMLLDMLYDEEKRIGEVAHVVMDHQLQMLKERGVQCK